MVFNTNEKELLLNLITVQQSKLVVNDNKNDEVIETYEIIKRKIKELSK